MRRSTLTQRQAEIASLLHQKLSNKMIASELGISHFTVRNHITILMLLLNVDARSRIPERAIDLGLINPPDPEPH
jgi:DNA-binding NarL/FixJ family response regulator